MYPIGAHWGWGDGGWLKTRGFSDFAGSGVVHVVGGVHALIGAIILGPRVDRFRDEESKYIAGHSIPLISLGGFILTFGFMAFNAGSQVSHFFQFFRPGARHLVIAWKLTVSTSVTSF